MTFPTAFDPVDGLTRPDGSTEPHEDDHGRIIGIWENVVHHGAKLNGVDDDTDALVRADDAIGARAGTIYVPEGRLKYSHFVPTGPRRILGVGWSATPNAVFGDASWNGSGEGTVLVCTAPSGVGLDLAATYERFQIEHLMLLGPGSGTATGIRSGGATGITPMAGGMNNVHIANFAKGLTLNGVNDAFFQELVIRGCSTGLDADYFTNQNTFVQTEVQYSTVDAIHMKAAAGNGGATQNNFYGGLVQNCTANGLRAAGNENHFYGFWLENTGITTGAIIAGTGNGLHDIHLAVDNSRNITLSGNGNFLSRLGGAPSIIAMSGVQNVIISNNADVTDTGSANNILAGVGGSNIFGGATAFADASFEAIDFDNNGSTVTVTERGNVIALVYPGVSEKTRLVQWHAAVGLPISNTAGRPSALDMGAGTMWYDTTLGIPIFSNGVAWTNAAGVVV